MIPNIANNYWPGALTVANSAVVNIPLPVPMRATPTCTIVDVSSVDIRYGQNQYTKPTSFAEV